MVLPNLRPWRDPYQGFNFTLEINGIIIGGFSEITGLESEVEVMDYQEGGVNTYVHQLPGPAKASPRVVMKRGMTDALELWAWFQLVRNPHPDMVDKAALVAAAGAFGLLVQGVGALFGQKPTRKLVTIYLKNQKGTIARWWVLRDAFPSKWSGADFKADDSTVTFETLELAYNGIMMQGAIPRFP